MATRLKFDEINALIGGYNEYDVALRKEELIDDVLDLLIVGYAWGVEDVNDMLGRGANVDAEAMRKSIYKKIDGKNFEERLSEYSDEGNLSAIQRVMETELHRNYNEAINTTAKALGAKYKTWQSMKDDKVREDHTYLEGQTIPIDADFYVGDAHAPAPGMFGVPEEDCNCRCYITVS